MKIAFFIFSPPFVQSNGVLSQALTWKLGLENLGHRVYLINSWDKNDWSIFDAAIFFGFSVNSADFIKLFYSVNKNIFVAPILDPNYSIAALKIYARWGCAKLRLVNPYYSLFKVRHMVKGFLVRSNFEKKYIIEGFDVPENKCFLVPLAYGQVQEKVNACKENFCLHISLLCDERKNVKRLINAAKKYKFKLVLAGKLRNKREEELLASWIGDSDNIEYKGFISNETKYDLYSKARVFALPSTNEGVGIVALEAAVMGADIVMTSLGGPKEYYNDMAKIVNPYDVDEIGNAIMFFLEGNTYQPNLKNYILENNSLENISKLLEKSLLGKSE